MISVTPNNGVERTGLVLAVRGNIVDVRFAPQLNQRQQAITAELLDVVKAMADAL